MHRPARKIARETDAAAGGIQLLTQLTSHANSFQKIPSMESFEMSSVSVAKKSFFRSTRKTSFLDQRQLLLPREALELRLAAHRLLFGRKGLVVRKLHGAARLRVLRACARVVRRDALVKVVRPAAVERPVRAAQEIGAISLRYRFEPRTVTGAMTSYCPTIALLTQKSISARPASSSACRSRVPAPRPWDTSGQ